MPVSNNCLSVIDTMVPEVNVQINAMGFRFMVALLHESLQLYCQMADLSQKLTQHHTDHDDMSVIQR